MRAGCLQDKELVFSAIYTLTYIFLFHLISLSHTLSLSLTGLAGSTTQIGVKSPPNRREIGSVIFGAESWGTVGPSSSL